MTRVTDLDHWRRPLVDITDRRALLACQGDAPEVTEAGRKLKEAALLDFGISQSVVASWLYSKCAYQIPTAAVPTAAVVASGDGTCLLLYNPEFFVEIGVRGVRFVLFHEARHLIHRHLHADQALLSDPVFGLAAEVSINHVAMERLRQPLPTRRVTDAEGGTRREPTGVDPREIHWQYKEDLTAQGHTPLDYDDFVRTDLTIYAELKRMRNPPVPPPQSCLHLTMGEGGSGDPLPMDDETVAWVVEEALSETMRAALRSAGPARDEILYLADRSESGSDRLSRLWGRLGLSALRGRTPKTGRVEWWKRWLVDTLSSRLREGERLVYPKKQGAVLLALGHEPLLSRRGPERTKVVVIAIDTSGSMPQDVIDWITSLVGSTDGVESHWLSFDGVVMPFVPGERVFGGGGTNFHHVVDYVEGRLEVDGKRCEVNPDAVIMVTDGHAPPVTPARPDRWIWLITDGGNDWPDHHEPAMHCHRVTTGDR